MKLTIKKTLGWLVVAACLGAGSASADRRVRVVRVRVAPPTIRVESRPPQPSAAHVWMSGYWQWNGRRHVWVAGRWVNPVRGRHWVDARWENAGGEWVFTPGNWEGDDGGRVETYVVPSNPSPVVIPPAGAPPPPPPPGPQGIAVGEPYPDAEWDVEVAPPPPRREPRPAPPDRGYVWIDGYWAWDGGQYVWATGHWEAGRPDVVWQPGRWERHGRHWKFHRGNWRHR